MWFIEHEFAHDDDTGEPLTWSNESGWGYGEPSMFTTEEKERYPLLPEGGRWIWQTE